MAWKDGKRTVYCRKCYETGHNRRNCPTNSEETKKRYANGGDLARKCSYCYTGGHTRRKCEKLNEDMKSDIVKNKEYRQKVAAYMEQKGLGVGSILKIADSQRETLFMVTGFDLDALTWRDVGYNFISSEPVKENDGWNRNFALPTDAPDANMYVWNPCEIVSPVSGEDVKPIFSEKWLSGETGLDKYYKKAR